MSDGPHEPVPGADLASATEGPWRFTVTWGTPLRPGFAVEHVMAWDAEEALVLAAARRPELARPTVAFPSKGP